MQRTKIFLCVDVDTIYGYYQSRFGSLGPSYKGVPMPLKAQKFYTSHSGWVQIKFIFVAYEMSNTFLDHMQLDLGRYHLPFGRYSLKYLSRNSRFWPFKPIFGAMATLKTTKWQPWRYRKKIWSPLMAYNTFWNTWNRLLTKKSKKNFELF